MIFHRKLLVYQKIHFTIVRGAPNWKKNLVSPALYRCFCPIIMFHGQKKHVETNQHRLLFIYIYLPYHRNHLRWNYLRWYRKYMYTYPQFPILRWSSHDFPWPQKGRILQAGSWWSTPDLPQLGLGNIHTQYLSVYLYRVYVYIYTYIYIYMYI